ncbi:MAG: hypothetical protein F6K54_14065 [Okeania sp. SIO3B5]|uniref:hypothetical protein n=1 Tax=Okeania sp. SIO3B5 TaxID=2607811 RepID=UPI0013FF4828|nr:hypothetical protein [Okeania sp. SIO3B5]NEO54107.1 hypothetical protein [Okeania sp. SIO3B5]
MKKSEPAPATITLGRQNPWVPGLEEIFFTMKAWHPEADLFDLLQMRPQMWACHSVEFEWGQLPLLSFSHLDTETGKFVTEIIVLPQDKSKIPSNQFLN